MTYTRVLTAKGVRGSRVRCYREWVVDVCIIVTISKVVDNRLQDMSGTRECIVFLGQSGLTRITIRLGVQLIVCE